MTSAAPASATRRMVQTGEFPLAIFFVICKTPADGMLTRGLRRHNIRHTRDLCEEHLVGRPPVVHRATMTGGKFAGTRKSCFVLMAGRKDLREPIRRKPETAAVLEPVEHLLQEDDRELAHAGSCVPVPGPAYMSYLTTHVAAMAGM